MSWGSEPHNWTGKLPGQGLFDICKMADSWVFIFCRAQTASIWDAFLGKPDDTIPIYRLKSRVLVQSWRITFRAALSFVEGCSFCPEYDTSLRNYNIQQTTSTTYTHGRHRIVSWSIPNSIIYDKTCCQSTRYPVLWLLSQFFFLTSYFHRLKSAKYTLNLIYTFFKSSILILSIKISYSAEDRSAVFLL